MPIISDARRAESTQQAAMAAEDSLPGESLSAGTFIGSGFAETTHIADGVCQRRQSAELEVS
ncbi:MAG: hypothetical protein ACKOAH_18720, partial [Pirellula sp.]